jgi:hypothetical protein
MLAHARATQARILAATDVAGVLAVVEDSLGLGVVHAATALRRLAVLKKRGAAVPYADPRYARLERLLHQDTANRLDARGLSAAAWAAAVLQRPALLDGMLQHSSARLAEASFQEHACVAWSLGRLRLGRQHGDTLNAVASACTSLLRDFSPLRLALSVLHGLTASGQDDADALRRLSTVNPQSLTRLVCGFASCGHAPPQQFMDALGSVAASQLRLFTGAQLAFTMAAHAQLGLPPSTPLLLAAPRAMEASLPAAGPLAASLALWSFARLRLQPPPSFLHTCDATLAQAGQPGLRAVSTARLAGAVWACGAFGWRPSASWPLLLDALESRELRPADGRALFTGLSRLQGCAGSSDADSTLQLRAAAQLDEAGMPPVRSVWLSCRPLPGS